VFNLHLFLEYDPRGGGCGGASGGAGSGGGAGDDVQRVPLLVVAQGATYSLTEKTAKRIVTSVVERVVADYTRVAANSGKRTQQYYLSNTSITTTTKGGEVNEM